MIEVGYRDWIINGIRPQYITSNGIDWSNFPQVTIHCAAKSSEWEDARKEIEKFEEFAAQEISNTPLISGGTRVQCSRDGKIVTIEEGDKTWRGAVHYPRFKEDQFSDQVIEWDLILELEIPSTRPQYRIYVPCFNKYYNIEYTPWTVEEGGGEWGGVIVARPGSVAYWEDIDGVPRTGLEWDNINNVTEEDGSVASCYNNNSTPKATLGLAVYDWIDTKTNESLSIDEGMQVDNYGFFVKYATDSVSRSSEYIRIYNTKVRSEEGFFIAYSNRDPYFLDLNGLPVSGDAANGPESLIWACWDTAHNIDLSIDVNHPKVPTTDVTFFSTDVTFFFRFVLDRYKHIWVDTILFKIWYSLYDTSQNEPEYDPGFSCSEIGKMTIKENIPVRLVEIAGSACNIPEDGAWIEVNGVRHYWHYSHDHQEGDTGNDGLEVLTFQLQEPTDTIEIKTSTHKPPGSSTNTAADNSGSMIQYIKVIYV